MTHQLGLLPVAPATAEPHGLSSPRSRGRRQGFTEKVAALFKAHPGEWLNAATIAAVGGRFASRTRISECRTDLGMRIDNRQRHVTDPETKETFTVSEYRWVP